MAKKKDGTKNETGEAKLNVRYVDGPLEPVPASDVAAEGLHIEEKEIEKLEKRSVSLKTPELKMEAAQQLAEAGEPNIIFFRKDREPPDSLHGVFKAALPDAETQKAGFFHPQASQIIAHRPRLYKRFKAKGDK